MTEPVELAMSEFERSGDKNGSNIWLHSCFYTGTERGQAARRYAGLWCIGKRYLLDKVSGKDFQRPAYRRLLKKLKPDDVLVVKSIDRLGRDYGEILDQWRVITKEKKTAIVVLDIPLLDTRQKERDLTGTFIADLVLQILSYVAQTEREFIRQRQAEGIVAAQARGVKFGRPALERPALFETVLEAWVLGEISAREAGRQLGISYTTFQAWAGQ